MVSQRKSKSNTEVCICFTLVNVLKYLKNVEGSIMNDYM